MSPDSKKDPIEKASEVKDAGQAEVQAKMDAEEESGFWPPGGPPDTSLTLEEVVKREQEEKEANAKARAEAAKEAEKAAKE